MRFRVFDLIFEDLKRNLKFLGLFFGLSLALGDETDQVEGENEKGDF